MPRLALLRLVLPHLALPFAAALLCAGAAHASFPGEPGLIAYTSGTDAIRLVGNGVSRPLTPGVEETQHHAAWSPGGRWVMYTAKGVWIVRPDGTGGRRLAPNGSDGDWSPDGRRVIFLSKPTRLSCTDVYSMRLNGRDVRRLTATSACERDPSYSPDGRRILFETKTSYAQHVVIATPGSASRVVLAGRSPDWSPDGRAVVFLAGERVVVADVGGRTLRTLDLRTTEHHGVIDVAWSPRGDRLVVTQVHAPPGCSIGVCRGYTRIYTVALDGSDRREVIGDDVSEPAWQPLPR